MSSLYLVEAQQWGKRPEETVTSAKPALGAIIVNMLFWVAVAHVLALPYVMLFWRGRSFQVKVNEPWGSHLLMNDVRTAEVITRLPGSVIVRYMKPKLLQPNVSRHDVIYPYRYYTLPKDNPHHKGPTHNWEEQIQRWYRTDELALADAIRYVRFGIMPS